MQGKIVLSEKLNSNKMNVNIEKLNSGLYFLKVTDANQIMIEKFIKQ